MKSFDIQSSHRSSGYADLCPGWLQIAFSLPPSGPSSDGGATAAGAAPGAAPGAAADSGADSSGPPDSGFRSPGEGHQS